jgi:hypothetical protein
MSQERRVETMRAAMAAFNRRDGEALGAVLAEDAEIVPVRAAVDGTVYRGPDAGAQSPIAPTPSTPWGCRIGRTRVLSRRSLTRRRCRPCLYGPVPAV